MSRKTATNKDNDNDDAAGDGYQIKKKQIPAAKL